MSPWALCTLLSGCAAMTGQLVVCALICRGFNLHNIYIISQIYAVTSGVFNRTLGY